MEPVSVHVICARLKHRAPESMSWTFAHDHGNVNVSRGFDSSNRIFIYIENTYCKQRKLVAFFFF